MNDVSVLLNRLDQLEAKVQQHDAKVAEHAAIVAEHELKINSQQIEIDQLKKKNSDTNPSAQSGVYSIDPDGQIGADEPILVYCDMTTGNSIYRWIYPI